MPNSNRSAADEVLCRDTKCLYYAICFNRSAEDEVLYRGSGRLANSIYFSRSAEDEVLCRGSGPRIRGMQKRVPKNSFFLLCRLLAS